MWVVVVIMTVSPRRWYSSPRAAIRPVSYTHLVMQYASNVSGTIQPMGEIGAICRRHGVLLAVDSAQAAGHFAFDMQKLQIDALCLSLIHI